MRTRILLLLAFVSTTAASAQTEQTAEIAKATDLVIPSSPAFVLLGVNPAKVAQPGFIEDFKLDLLIKENNLAPDMAIAAKPIWVFFYDDVGLSAYRGKSLTERVLSTLGLSLGTATQGDLQRLAWAAKLNLIRRDPLMDTAYTNRVSSVLDVSERQRRLSTELFNAGIAFRRRIREIDEMDVPEAQKETLREEATVQRDITTRRVQEQLQRIEDTLTDSVQAIVRRYTEEHWNDPAVDFAVGQLYNYTGGTLSDLRLQSKGLGAWLNAASGFGSESWLFSALARVLDIEDERGWQWGVNARYGGSRFNFFLEYLTDLEGDEDSQEIAYGGDYRFAENRKIQFGIRTAYDENFKLRQLVPVVKADFSLGELSIPDILRRR